MTRFGQAWTDYAIAIDAAEPKLHSAPRDALKAIARQFFDFSVAELARHQLTNQRVIPGFEPSPESYAPAVEVVKRGRSHLARLGVEGADKLDLFTAVARWTGQRPAGQRPVSYTHLTLPTICSV